MSPPLGVKPKDGLTEEKKFLLFFIQSADYNLLATDDVEARLQVRSIVSVANLGTVDGEYAFRSNSSLFVSYYSVDGVNVASASDYDISEFALILL